MAMQALVHTTRGFNGNDNFQKNGQDHIENIHYGSVAVVNSSGKLLHSVGDPNHVTFSRSTIKPFQATPFITGGGMAEFKLTLEEVALICSSHSGEAFHVACAQSILAKAGLTSSQLQCGCHVPMYFGATGKRPAEGEEFSVLHNNCSGKHIGFLAWCAMNDKLTETYLHPEHPLQVAIRRSLSIWCDERPENFLLGMDGCSAPNYALPLQKLALGYARLASLKGGGTAKTLFDAMTLHPDYVSGTDRHDLAFMQQGKGDWVAKIGADGVQLIGIRSAGIGIAVKISDGDQRAVITATVEVLRQLGLVSDLSETPLARWVEPKLNNAMGIQTGRVKPVFSLLKS